VSPLKVAIVCDFAEEGWHSMDLWADMLLENLPRVSGGAVSATRLQPTLMRRWQALPIVGRTARARLADRLTGRHWDYPRWLATQHAGFDVFHIVDHSYAHLTDALPRGKAIVTCHDLDAIRAGLPGFDRLAPIERLMAGRVLSGLRGAARIACVSEATRSELIAANVADAARISVVHAGVHPSCVPDASTAQNGSLLHVGSTIPRKRIDVLLDVFAGVRAGAPKLRLIRVGGRLTSSQRARAATLGVLDAIDEMPTLERHQLADIYRRAAIVLLPSDREGFGLPLAEAMACGTPVVASALPSLQEVGGSAAVYCPPANPGAWIQAVESLLKQRERDADAWKARRDACVRNAARFNWQTHTAEMVKLYSQVAAQ
jgi:glycosyltransferase involved in cell wall biosynthesis